MPDEPTDLAPHPADGVLPQLEELQDGELERCEEELRRTVIDEARMLWRRGLIYNRVRDRGLYRQAGCRSFGAWVDERSAYSRAHVYRAMRIAREFSQLVAERYGVAKLEAILRYLRVTPGEEEVGDVFALDIRLKDTHGRFFTKPITEASAAEIHASAELMEEAKQGGTRVPRETTRRVARLARALPGVGSERASVKRHRNGQLVVSFRDIPVDEIEAFLEAVRAHLRG